jgi:predicted nucleic acid-binding protein
VIVVDSSVWIDHLRGILRPEVRLLSDLLTGAEIPILVGDIVLFEVLVGYRDARAQAVARETLERCVVVSMLDRDLLMPAVTAHRRMQDRGITLSLPDTLIGSYCLAHGYRLLSRDRVFEAMRDHLGLALIDPATFRPEAG